MARSLWSIRHFSPWYHGWNIVALCVVVQSVALGLTLNCFSLFLHDWTVEFHLPVSTFALSITILSAGCALTAPFAGRAADRFPARTIFCIALISLAVIHLAISLVGSGWQIVAIYAVFLPVVVTFSTMITCQTVVLRWFARRTGLAMGLTAFGLVLAGVVFPSVIVRMLPEFGWRGVWQMFAGLIIVVVLPLVWLGMRDAPVAPDAIDSIEKNVIAPNAPSLTVREVFSRRNFWITVAVFLPIQCTCMTMIVNLTPIVISYGHSTAVAGTMIATMSVSAMIAKVAAGALADRVGQRVPMVITSLLCVAGLATLVIWSTNVLLLAAAFVMIGLSQGVWTLLGSATAAEFGQQGFGRAYGLISMFPPVASITPVVIARFHEASGSYYPGLIGLATMALVGTAVALFLSERPQLIHRPR